MKTDKVISLGYGSGGLLTQNLIRQVVLKYFNNPIIKQLEDSAELSIPDRDIAFTTDSYVVNPIFFPGGDIGKLAICGTINDLVMKGAIPKFISFSMIIEEGFRFDDLNKILASASRAAKRAKVLVVCGDTKVVEKDKADKIFITTSGIGTIKVSLTKKKIKPGDKIIISGTIGEHGIVIMNERLNLGLMSHIKSDVYPLNLIAEQLFNDQQGLHFMRDPTRGGAVSVLNEAAQGMNFGIVINEQDLPIKKEVIGVAEILGIDPLYVANEGKFIALVENSAAERFVKKIQSHPRGRAARIIGEVVKKPKGVWLKTKLGVQRPLLQLEAEGLPRIC